MKPAALIAAAAIVIGLGLGACSKRSRDREREISGGAVADPPDVRETPRARPAELGHLTLKVLGMT